MEEVNILSVKVKKSILGNNFYECRFIFLKTNIINFLTAIEIKDIGKYFKQECGKTYKII